MHRSLLALTAPVVLAVAVAAAPARAGTLNPSLLPFGWLVGTWSCVLPERGPNSAAYVRTFHVSDGGGSIAFSADDEGTLDEGTLGYDRSARNVVATATIHDAGGFRSDESLALADVGPGGFALEGIERIHRGAEDDEELKIQREFSHDGAFLTEIDRIWSDDAWNVSSQTYCSRAAAP